MQTSEMGPVRYSPEQDKLSPALVAVQAAVTGIDKLADGKFGSYPRLAEVIAIARPALTDNNCAALQFPGMDGAGLVTLTTRIIHESGQWIEGTARAPMPDLSEKQEASVTPAQRAGGVTTYLRRYSLMSLLLMAAEDSDGAYSPGERPVTRLTPVATTPATSGPGIVNAPAPVATAAQPAAVDEAAEKLLRQDLQSAILAECARLNADIGAFEASLAKRGAKAITDLTTDQMREAVAAMKAQPAPTEVVT